MTAATSPMTAERWTPFLDTVEVEGLDMAGGTFAMQVRLYKDAPGDPLLSLSNATAGTQGLSVTSSEIDDVPVSVITVQIDEATIEAILPFAVTDGSPNRRAGSDLVLAYDLIATATGFPKQRLIEGDFTIKAGVTV